MKAVGVDIGSLETKVVLLDDKNIVDYRVGRSTYDFKRVGSNLFKDLLDQHNLKKNDVFVAQKFLLFRIVYFSANGAD